MVEPIGFGANPETADDNVFQQRHGDDSEVEQRALKEYATFRRALEEGGIGVLSFSPNDGLATPDAVFPNNWFSTHPGGVLVLYPMRAPNRRLERRVEIIDVLRANYPNVLDLTHEEDDGRFLEGTGSLVIDESTRIVYASVSTRTSAELVEIWAKRFDYQPVLFSSCDRNGREIYHTNVVMSVTSEFAVICSNAIVSTADRTEVVASLSESGRRVIEISSDQMHEFCGNILGLENEGGRRIVAMSDRALAAFSEEQRRTIEQSAEIVHTGIETIEKYGGGGARCMLAELN